MTKNGTHSLYNIDYIFCVVKMALLNCILEGRGGYVYLMSFLKVNIRIRRSNWSRSSPRYTSSLLNIRVCPFLDP